MSSQRQQAAFDFNAKAVLERQLLIRIQKYNEKLIIAVTKSVARTGEIPDMLAFQPELEDILLQHYTAVGNVFVQRVNDMVLAEEGGKKSLIPVDQNPFTLYIEQKAAAIGKIPVVVNKYFKTLAIDVGGKITETTAREAQDSLDFAMSQARKPEAVSLDQLQIAGDTGATFRRRLNGRSTGLVRINTNNPAEATKMTQISLLRGEEPAFSGGIGGSTGTKTWNNIGDSRVRFPGEKSNFNHQDAEQTVLISEPFRVSGQSLRFPGDTSMGASLGNIINCRCSATYDIKDAVKARNEKRNRGLSVPELGGQS